MKDIKVYYPEDKKPEDSFRNNFGLLIPAATHATYKKYEDVPSMFEWYLEYMKKFEKPQEVKTINVKQEDGYVKVGEVVMHDCKEYIVTQTTAMSDGSTTYILTPKYLTPHITVHTQSAPYLGFMEVTITDNIGRRWTQIMSDNDAKYIQGLTFEDQQKWAKQILDQQCGPATNYGTFPAAPSHLDPQVEDYLSGKSLQERVDEEQNYDPR